MSTVNLGFENNLWEMADKLRGNIEASEYKHVVLGLIFLKYISDAFEERYNELVEEGEGFEEDIDAYTEVNVFYVPKEARWDYIKANAKQPTIGQIIDEAMIAIEKENVSLKGVLPKNYARPEIDKTKLGELIDLFSFKVGDKEARAQDVLGRVYEYFLGKFGSSEGEFYTPPSIVKLLVEMIEPYKGRVYDPCCGSGGMFVQSQRFGDT
jgi:type I restriction enzyme M protein